jgi:hypothetical protein
MRVLNLELQNEVPSGTADGLNGRCCHPHGVHANGALVCKHDNDSSQLPVLLCDALLMCAQEIALHSNAQTPGERKDELRF